MSASWHRSSTWGPNNRALWSFLLRRTASRSGAWISIFASDAHLPEHVGLGISEACALLQQTGFRYLATYEKRKPELNRL